MTACALLLTGIGSGCGDDDPPRSPIAPPPPSPSPAPVLSRITLTGPTTVSLGTTADFTVTAHLSDGSTRDATAEVNWSTNPAILAMSSPGRFLAKSSGDTSLAANLLGRSATIGTVIVVPAGTYRLVGAARDEGLLLPGVTVEIDSEGLGRTSIVSPDGSYKVFGVAGQTRITVSKDGYRTTFRDLTITNHLSVVFDMALADTRRDVSGRYTVTFTAAPECTSLPDEVKVRSYPATVVQTGPRLTVTLDGDRFYTSFGRRHNRFSGTVVVDVVRFYLSAAYDYWSYSLAADIFEELPDRSHYAVDGSVVITLSSPRLEGDLSGGIGIYGAASQFRPITRCQSTRHRLSLQR